MKFFYLRRREPQLRLGEVVAQGVEFDDGSCVIHWLEAPRSTGLYTALRDVIRLYGQEKGETYLELDGDVPKVSKVSKPHLALGFEGPGAEIEALMQGCGIVQPGARAAYDNVRSITAPFGWHAVACFFITGEVCLTVRSPERFLHETTLHFEGVGRRHRVYEQFEACFRIDSRGIADAPQSRSTALPDVAVWVDGVRGSVYRKEYSTG